MKADYKRETPNDLFWSQKICMSKLRLHDLFVCSWGVFYGDLAEAAAKTYGAIRFERVALVVLPSANRHTVLTPPGYMK